VSKQRNAPPATDADALFGDAPESEFARELRIARELRGHRDPPKEARPRFTPLPDPGIDIMVIGDAHAGPGQSLRRFRWFGKMAAAQRPAVIISIGDWASMESCGSFDRPGSVQFRAKDFYADIDAAVAAREVFEGALAAGKSYKPRKLETLGNHEHRIQRVAESDHRFAELFNYDLLQHARYGWERHAFLSPVDVAGFTVVHYFTNPGTGKPIGGVGANPPRLVFSKIKCAGIWGHSHRFYQWRETDMHGNRRDVLNVGCAFEHEEHWAGTDNRYWDRGILMLRNARDGTADVEWWSLERVRREYGP
jgi:hypothetical protein